MIRQFRNLVGLLCLMAVTGFTFGAEAAEVTLRFAGNTPPDHQLTRGLELFGKLIEQKSKGAVAVQVYPGGQLFTDKDMPKAVPTGAVDGGVVNYSFWTGQVPTLNVLYLPFNFTDHTHIWRVVDGEPGKRLIQDLKEKGGVKLLYWIDFTWIDFMSRKPMRNLEEVKGKRIRAIGEEDSAAIRAMGGAPVVMGGGEVYMALQKGTIDSSASGTPSFVERKYYEVSKYVTLAQFQYNMFGVLMNQKRWEGLSPEIQKAINEASQEAQDWGRKESLKVRQESLEILKSKGVDIFTLSKDERARWKVACSPAVEHYSRRTGEAGKTLVELIEKLR